MSKHLTAFILAVLLSTTSFAQKPRTLQSTDPLVGNWKFNADSTGHKVKAPVLGGAEVISLLPGLEVCMLAKSYDTYTGKYHVVSYFVARKDSSRLYGDIAESDNPQWNGKSFSCLYEYHKNSDMLVLLVNGKKYFYSRTE